MTDAVPVAVPVKVTEQLPAVNPQLAALNEPPVVPADNVNITVPVGVFDTVVVSVTVATQVDAWFITTRLAHVTAVIVLSFTL
jgi:hypothetical protein